MNDPHVAIVRLDDGFFLATGLTLFALTDQATHLEPDRLAGQAFGEIGLGLARRVCREEGFNLVLRIMARSGELGAAILLTGHAPREEDALRIGALARGAIPLFARWRGEGLDRSGLDQVLALNPDWDAVRLSKHAPDWHDAASGSRLAIWSALNVNLEGWGALSVAPEFDLDVGLFPLFDQPKWQERVRSAMAASTVLARRKEAERDGLQSNAQAGQKLLHQALFVGSSLTLLGPDAASIARELQPFCDPLRGALGAQRDWTIRGGEMPPEELGFFALDYSTERDAAGALEPDPRAALGLPYALSCAWRGWQPPLAEAPSATDPWENLLARIDLFERTIDRKLEELRETVLVARVNVKTGLGHARRISEGIVERCFQRNFPHEQKKPLERMIEKLREGGKIPSDVASLMHTVRVFGNLGAHHTDHAVSTQHLVVVLESLCLLVQWHLEQEGT